MYNVYEWYSVIIMISTKISTHDNFIKFSLKKSWDYEFFSSTIYSPEKLFSVTLVSVFVKIIVFEEYHSHVTILFQLSFKISFKMNFLKVIVFFLQNNLIELRKGWIKLMPICVKLKKIWVEWKNVVEFVFYHAISNYKLESLRCNQSTNQTFHIHILFY